MHLCYLDEADDKTNYYVTALLVQDSDVKKLHLALEEVMEYSEVKYLIPRDTEIHGYSIVQGEHHWKILKSNIEARKDILVRTMKAISAYDVRIYIRGVPLNHYRSRYGTHLLDIHRTALIWTLERVQNYAASVDSDVLLISDELRQGHDELRKSIKYFQINPTYGYRGVVLDRVIDTIHFAPSNSSRLLQAADLISYAHHRNRRQHSTPELTDFHYGLWRILMEKHLVKDASVWQPN
jgi:hypothetical protein